MCKRWEAGRKAGGQSSTHCSHLHCDERRRNPEPDVLDDVGALSFIGVWGMDSLQGPFTQADHSKVCVKKDGRKRKRDGRVVWDHRMSFFERPLG